MYGNRRGVRCIIHIDAWTLFLPWRFIPAWMILWGDEWGVCQADKGYAGMQNPKLFKFYSITRRATFYMHAIILVACLFGFIGYISFNDDIPFDWYTYALVAVICAAFYLMADYHFNDVVYFWDRHPTDRKVRIQWIMSDSEPDF